MDEKRAKRLIMACTVGAVLLAVILFMVMIYQLIAIGVKQNKINYYNSEIAKYDQMIENNQDRLYAMKQKEWIIYEARKLGYRFEGDSIIK